VQDFGVSTVTRASEEAKSSDPDDFVKVEKEDTNQMQQVPFILYLYTGTIVIFGVDSKADVRILRRRDI
jgi:hypothetical protein